MIQNMTMNGQGDIIEVEHRTCMSKALDLIPGTAHTRAE